MNSRSPDRTFTGPLIRGLPWAVLALGACSAPEGAVDSPAATSDSPLPAASWLTPPPPKTPEIFAPGAISRSDVYEFGCSITADGRTCFFGVELGDRPEIRFAEWSESGWAEPRLLLGHKEHSFHDPMLSPDESRLYFISNRPASGSGAAKDSDIWYVARRGEGWSDPIQLGPAVNSPADEYYISFTRDGHLYFASNVRAQEDQSNNYDLYRARWVDGEFEKAAPLPGLVNTGAYEADVFVSPDETWLIVCSTRRSGLGRGDLYLSVRESNGDWSAVQTLGAPINTGGHELCPYVTADGKRLMYTSQLDIMVVDAAILRAQ